VPARFPRVVICSECLALGNRRVGVSPEHNQRRRVRVFERLLPQALERLGVHLLRVGNDPVDHLDPENIRLVLQFDGLPKLMIEPTLWTVIAVELVLGSLLAIFLWYRSLVLLAAIALLLLFCVQLGYLLSIPDSPDCGCMGALRITNFQGLMRNICLILAAFWTWVQLSPPTRSDTMSK
jgi:hypothetical protein